MKSETKLVISRYWHQPQIEVYVDSEQIQVRMPIEDFCKAVVKEISHPVTTLTRAQLEKNILGVLVTVLNKAKEATAQG